MSDSTAPKIELHVHLEGAVRADALLEIATRNGVALPVAGVEELTALYEFTDFEHFIELWMMTTHAIQTEVDFRQIVVSYAEEAASHGAVYIEGIFTPAERVSGGASWDEVFTGFCDGAVEASEQHGVAVRLTPDMPRSFGLDAAMETVRYSIKYRERGIVGVGLGGQEASYPPEPFEEAFRVAKDGGLGSVPHAGEVAGVESIRGAIDALQADRLRHGVRAVEDPGLLRELAAREIVCDVCPVSNLRTRVFASVETHPLPAMLAAGVLCSISTDDPAMFDTDLTREYEVAARLGCSPRAAFAAGVRGALCDEPTRAALRTIAEAFAWSDDRP
ncbi:MAG: aminodeoxyfutalosine deaminase [Actinomycetota bacterium]|nr:aminodeoxyfutalosine deaminase [Actinomycetota bacterium]